MKICSRCKIERSFAYFSKDNNALDGFKNRCKECDRLYYKSNKQKYVDTYLKNRDKIKQYYVRNSEKLIEYQKEYRLRNSNKYNVYVKNRTKNDINFKIAKLLRTRLYNALKGNSKSGSAVRDLGCTIPELKVWLEQRFKSSMSWENYGEWHIDHVVPLASFDLTNKEQFLKACHYTNLQPLWAKENFKKHDMLLE